MPDLQELRERLITGLRASGALHDDRVAAAMTAVPRHAFLPGVEPGQAYADDAVVTKLDSAGRPVSSSSQPAIMALMLEQLGVRPGDRVLEIGAGTGYNAALLAHLAGRAGTVSTVDLDAGVVAAAREHLDGCGFGRVSVIHADGGNGWPPGAPYHRIIVTVGAWDITPAWIAQLAPGGRLVLPLALRAGMQYSIAFERAGDHLDSVSALPCGFMRLRGAYAGPETVIPLGDRTGVLAEVGPRPAGAEELQALLARPGENAGSGVRATMADVYGGLGLWLAMNEPGIGRLSAFGAVTTSGPAASLVIVPGQPGTGILTSAHGCAVLVGLGGDGAAAAGLHAPFEVGACPFGAEGTELASRLVRRVRDWAAAGRPSVADLRVSVYPDGAILPGAPGATVIGKPCTRLLLGWRDGALSPGLSRGLPRRRQAAGEHGEHVVEHVLGHVAACRPVRPAHPDEVADPGVHVRDDLRVIPRVDLAGQLGVPHAAGIAAGQPLVVLVEQAGRDELGLAHDPVHPRPARQQIEERAEGRPLHLALTVRLLDGRAHRRPEVGVDPADDRGEDLRLGPEMRVEAAGRDAGPGADVRHRRLPVTPFGEELLGSRQQPIGGRGGPRPPAGRRCHKR